MSRLSKSLSPASLSLKILSRKLKRSFLGSSGSSGLDDRSVASIEPLLAMRDEAKAVLGGPRTISSRIEYQHCRPRETPVWQRHTRVRAPRDMARFKETRSPIRSRFIRTVMISRVSSTPWFRNSISPQSASQQRLRLYHSKTYPIHSSAGGKLVGFSTSGDERNESNSSISYRRAMRRKYV